MTDRPRSPTAIFIDLRALGDAVQGNGPQWSHESVDLDLTFLSWQSGREIAAHVNGEVDVVLFVVAGTGDVIVNGEIHALTAGQALLIPKGLERAIRCTGGPFSYLSIHRRHAGLWPTVRGFS
jgi:mannose-6-phosphate isomerase-like protein (cupin superfamily)